LNEITRRHEVLRTYFVEIQGEAAQAVRAPDQSMLSIVDLEHLSPTERETLAPLLAREEAQHAFDLATGPMLRARLVRLGRGDHILLFTMHHIVSDAWSAGVLVKEVVALYISYTRGERSPLPELTAQYADYAVWQRESLTGEALDNHVRYWETRLRGMQTLLLPTDGPRPKAQTYSGARQSFVVESRVMQSLKKLAREEGATLFMTLLAAFQTFMHRYSGQSDIVIGTDLANRNRAEIEPLIGFFVNILPMRADFSGEPSFREMTRRTQKVALEAYAHQDLPFEKLVAALKLERDLSRHPIFQVIFVLQNAPAGNLELGELVLKPVPIECHSVKFDLAMFMTERGDTLVGYLDYNTDLFHSARISRMIGQFQRLLEELTARPDASVGSAEILSEEEKQQSAMEEKLRKEAAQRRLVGVRRKPVNILALDMVRTGYLPQEASMPLVVEPNIDNINLADWAVNNGAYIEENLLKHGAILFRGFNVSSPGQFQKCAQSMCDQLFGDYGDLPRERMGEKLYGSTPYPSDQSILFHNESSHTHRWPMKIWFFCSQPSASGGETPIIDCRRVYKLLDPVIRERFAEKGLMYLRNYTDRLDVSWQAFFRTEDRAVVEQKCRSAGVEFEWKEENGLRTRQVSLAVARHPKTGEDVFFNQLQLHHILCLNPTARQSVISLFQEEDFPRNVYYGDGSPIEDYVVDEVREVYQRAAVSFPWQQGDILMLDNMLTAHARNPYTGPRKILVAMGEMFDNTVAVASRF
jgi:hypothetical protein